MGYIVRNGISYFGDNAVELTQAEYDALPASKLTDGVDYYITDAQAGAPLATEIAMSSSDSRSVKSVLDTLTNGLFKIVNHTSSSITLNAGGAVGVTATMMGIDAYPVGYIPLAVNSWYCTSNGVFARSLNIYAIGAQSFCVLKSVETSTVTFTYEVQILYVKQAYSPISS